MWPVGAPIADLAEVSVDGSDQSLLVVSRGVGFLSARGYTDGSIDNAKANIQINRNEFESPVDGCYSPRFFGVLPSKGFTFTQIEPNDTTVVLSLNIQINAGRQAFASFASTKTVRNPDGSFTSSREPAEISVSLGGRTISFSYPPSDSNSSTVLVGFVNSLRTEAILQPGNSYFDLRNEAGAYEVIDDSDFRGTLSGSISVNGYEASQSFSVSLKDDFFEGCESCCKAGVDEGACCNGTTCSVKPQCQCDAAAGEVFKGVGTVCSPNPCNECLCPDGSTVSLPDSFTVKVKVDTVTPAPVFDNDGTTVIGTPPSDAADFLKQQIEQEWSLIRVGVSSTYVATDDFGFPKECRHPLNGGFCCSPENNFYSAKYGKSFFGIQMNAFCDGVVLMLPQGNFGGEAFTMQGEGAWCDACAPHSVAPLTFHKWRFEDSYDVVTAVPQHDPCSGPMPSFAITTAGNSATQRQGFVSTGYDGDCGGRYTNSLGQVVFVSEHQFFVSPPVLEITPNYANPLP